MRDIALDLSRNSRSLFREPLDERRSISDLGPRFRERLAALGRRDRGQRLGVGPDRVVPGPQRVGACARGSPSPAFKRVLRVLDRGLRLLRAAVRDVCQDIIGGRVGDGEGGRCRAPAAAGDLCR